MPTTLLAAGDVSLYLDYTSRALDGADPGKPTLVLLHGYPDTHATWSSQVEVLRQHYHVATFDMRGVGGSTAPTASEAYRIERVLPDIAAVIDFMVGPEGQVHLVGHDWGSLLGWRFVSEPRYAPRVVSYTAIAGPHPDLAFALTGERLKHPSPRSLKELAAQTAQSWYVWFFQVPVLPELLWKLMPERLWQSSHRDGGIAEGDPLLRADRREILGAAVHPIHLYRQLSRGLIGQKSKVPASPIAVPCCLIIPDRDFALRPSIYENTSRYVESLEIHHLDANHWVHRSRPEEVSGLIRSFVDRHPVPVVESADA